MHFAISEETYMLMKEMLIGDHLVVFLDRHLGLVQDLLTCPPGGADNEWRQGKTV